MASILGRSFFEYTYFFLFYKSVNTSKHIAVQHLIKNKKRFGEKEIAVRVTLDIILKQSKYIKRDSDGPPSSQWTHRGHVEIRAEK